LLVRRVIDEMDESLADDMVVKVGDERKVRNE
jgi:hypothetical protein